MTDAQRSELDRAVEVRRQAETYYRETLTELLEDGVSYADLGRALGVSRQAVNQYLRKEAK